MTSDGSLNRAAPLDSFGFPTPFSGAAVAFDVTPAAHWPATISALTRASLTNAGVAANQPLGEVPLVSMARPYITPAVRASLPTDVGKALVDTQEPGRYCTLLAAHESLQRGTLGIFKNVYNATSMIGFCPLTSVWGCGVCADICGVYTHPHPITRTCVRPSPRVCAMYGGGYCAGAIPTCSRSNLYGALPCGDCRNAPLFVAHGTTEVITDTLAGTAHDVIVDDGAIYPLTAPWYPPSYTPGVQPSRVDPAPGVSLPAPRTAVGGGPVGGTQTVEAPPQLMCVLPTRSYCAYLGGRGHCEATGRCVNLIQSNETVICTACDATTTDAPCATCTRGAAIHTALSTVGTCVAPNGPACIGAAIAVGVHGDSILSSPTVAAAREGPAAVFCPPHPAAPMGACVQSCPGACPSAPALLTESAVCVRADTSPDACRVNVWNATDVVGSSTRLRPVEGSDLLPPAGVLDSALIPSDAGAFYTCPNASARTWRCVRDCLTSCRTLPIAAPAARLCVPADPVAGCASVGVVLAAGAVGAVDGREVAAIAAAALGLAADPPRHPLLPAGHPILCGPAATCVASWGCATGCIGGIARGPLELPFTPSSLTTATAATRVVVPHTAESVGGGVCVPPTGAGCAAAGRGEAYCARPLQYANAPAGVPPIPTASVVAAVAAKYRNVNPPPLCLPTCALCSAPHLDISDNECVTASAAACSARSGHVYCHTGPAGAPVCVGPPFWCGGRPNVTAEGADEGQWLQLQTAPLVTTHPNLAVALAQTTAGLGDAGNVGCRSGPVFDPNTGVCVAATPSACASKTLCVRHPAVNWTARCMPTDSCVGCADRQHRRDDGYCTAATECGADGLFGCTANGRCVTADGCATCGAATVPDILTRRCIVATVAVCRARGQILCPATGGSAPTPARCVGRCIGCETASGFHPGMPTCIPAGPTACRAASATLSDSLDVAPLAATIPNAVAIDDPYVLDTEVMTPTAIPDTLAHWAMAATSWCAANASCVTQCGYCSGPSGALPISDPATGACVAGYAPVIAAPVAPLPPVPRTPAHPPAPARSAGPPVALADDNLPLVQWADVTALSQTLHQCPASRVLCGVTGRCVRSAECRTECPGASAADTAARRCVKADGFGCMYSNGGTYCASDSTCKRGGECGGCAGRTLAVTSPSVGSICVAATDAACRAAGAGPYCPRRGTCASVVEHGSGVAACGDCDTLTAIDMANWTCAAPLAASCAAAGGTLCSTAGACSPSCRRCAQLPVSRAAEAPTAAIAVEPVGLTVGVPRAIASLGALHDAVGPTTTSPPAPISYAGPRPLPSPLPLHEATCVAAAGPTCAAWVAARGVAGGGLCRVGHAILLTHAAVVAAASRAPPSTAALDVHTVYVAPAPLDGPACVAECAACSGAPLLDTASLVCVSLADCAAAGRVVCPTSRRCIAASGCRLECVGMRVVDPLAARCASADIKASTAARCAGSGGFHCAAIGSCVARCSGLPTTLDASVYVHKAVGGTVANGSAAALAIGASCPGATGADVATGTCVEDSPASCAAEGKYHCPTTHSCVAAGACARDCPSAPVMNPHISACVSIVACSATGHYHCPHDGTCRAAFDCVGCHGFTFVDVATSSCARRGLAPSLFGGIFEAGVAPPKSPMPPFKTAVWWAVLCGAGFLALGAGVLIVSLLYWRFLSQKRAFADAIEETFREDEAAALTDARVRSLALETQARIITAALSN